MTDIPRFDDFLRRVEAEAAAEGPEAVAELEAFRDHYRLARELARCGQSRGWTQSHLSELTGVPQSEISRIERGWANPTLMTISRLSSALGARLSLRPCGGAGPGEGAAPAHEPSAGARATRACARAPRTGARAAGSGAPPPRTRRSGT